MRLSMLALLAAVSMSAFAEPMRITVPRGEKPPVVDGIIAPGEWDDAAAVTGLLSQFGQAAHPRQAVFWIKYDDKNIYIAQRSTCFPEELTGAAPPPIAGLLWGGLGGIGGIQEEITGAVPPLWFGLDRDSSVVVGLDPARLGRGAKPSHFLLRANVNKKILGQEIFWELEGGGKEYAPVKITFPNPEWTSGATVEQKIEKGVWVSEMSIPLKNLKADDLKDGEEWGLLLGRDYSAADQCALTLSSDWRFGDGNRHYNRAFYNNYRLEKEYGRMKLGGNAPVVQMLDLGNVLGGRLTPTVSVKNPTATPMRVVVREEWRAAAQYPPQECTLDLQPGETKSHTFKAVELAKGGSHLCRITATGPDGILLAQEIPVNPGWGQDRAASMPEPYFSGGHFGLKDKFDGPLFSTGYDPITNEFYGRLLLGNLPEAPLAVRGDLAIRRQGVSSPVATLPIAGEPVVGAVEFSVYEPGTPSAAVLEWVAPRDGVAAVHFKGAHMTNCRPEDMDGEAMQVWLYDKAAGKARELIPRKIFSVYNEWLPIEATGVKVRAGDSIQFYYDMYKNGNVDRFLMSGNVTLATKEGVSTFDPVLEFASRQGGANGVWRYGYDTDTTPNADGVYPPLGWDTKITYHNNHECGGFARGWVKKWEKDPNTPGVMRHMALITHAIDQKTWIVKGQLPPLTPGVYEATASLYAKDGRVLGRARQMFVRFDHRKDLPWLFEKVGESAKVLPPWTPITMKDNSKPWWDIFSADDVGAAPLVLDCWGRAYQIGANGLLNGIVNQGAAQLTAPVGIEARQEGKPVALAADNALTDIKNAGNEASYSGQQQGGGLQITVNGRMEYDGYLEHKITLAPEKGAAKIDSLRLVIPLKPEDATHLHATGGEWFRSAVASIKLGEREGQLWNSGQRYGGGCVEPDKVPFGKTLMTVGNFRPYVWIGNAERGLAFMADNDSGWVPDDSGTVPAIEVLRTKDSVNLVLNLVARPFTLEKPRTITFSLQATPIRSLPDDIRERNRASVRWDGVPGRAER